MATVVGLPHRILDQAVEEDEVSEDKAIVVKAGTEEGIDDLGHSGGRGT